MLWKLVTLEKIPRVERVLKVKPTTKTWREIYRLQHRTAPVARRKPKVEDFVLSFELKKGEQMLAEGAGPLVSPPEDATCLAIAPLWESEQAPKVLRDAWDDNASHELWDVPHPLLSIWVTRDMQTVPLYVEAKCQSAGDDGAAGEIESRGYYDFRELPEIHHYSSLFNWPIRESLLHADFDEANGSITIRVNRALGGGELDGDEWSGTSILEYLDVLVPRSTP